MLSFAFFLSSLPRSWSFRGFGRIENEFGRTEFDVVLSLGTKLKRNFDRRSDFESERISARFRSYLM